MVTISFGVLIFGDKINLVNGIGVIVTVTGIVAYNQHRFVHRITKLCCSLRPLTLHQQQQQQHYFIYWRSYAFE